MLVPLHHWYATNIGEAEFLVNSDSVESVRPNGATCRVTLKSGETYDTKELYEEVKHILLEAERGKGTLQTAPEPE